MTLHLTEQVMKINETLPVFELIKTSIIRVQEREKREGEKKSRINTSSMLVSVSSGSQGHRHLSQS